MNKDNPHSLNGRNMHKMLLRGCTPEPLMSYLKALGIFRLVSEQADHTCRAAWKNGQFELLTSLSKEDLIIFLTEKYEPSPMFSPWNGDGGFLSDSGSSYDTIQTIQSSKIARLTRLKHSISLIQSMTILSEFGQLRKSANLLDKKKKNKTITESEKLELSRIKKQVKDLKGSILFQIRTEFPDQSLGWFDTCLQISQDGFSVTPALGSGGVDGRMEFSANFLLNILLVLDSPFSDSWAKYSLYAEGSVPLHSSSIGQFSPGNIGGPNATQGFEGDSALNPWDYILMIEGTPLLAGSISRRCDTKNFAKAIFPFTVLPIVHDGDSVEKKDSNSARGEIWLPLWEKFIKLPELEKLFGEGRADWSGHQSRTNVDFARAIASLGVEKGVSSFSRHGFLQRNGLAYLATPLGRFNVNSNPDVDLLKEPDQWIERFRRACGDKSPGRFSAALRRLDSTIFNFCQFGEKQGLQRILIALGQAEYAAAQSPKFRENSWLLPLERLSSDWVRAADDNSPEFEIASALAGIQGIAGYPGIRANMECVDYDKGRLNWKDDSVKAVWNRGSLPENLCAVLQRRLLDWKRLSLPCVPIQSKRTVSPATIARFIYGELDDEKIDLLLKALICCRIEWKPVSGSIENVPRSYALLKTCFTPTNPRSEGPGAVSTKFWEKLKRVKTDSRIISLILANRLDEALESGRQRLRNAGLISAPIQWETKAGFDPVRLGAALLFPVRVDSAENLWNLVSSTERSAVSERISMG